MLPIYAQLSRHAIEANVRSALPDAPVSPPPEDVPAAATRRSLAVRLVALADHLSPDPVERSRWESG